MSRKFAGIVQRMNSGTHLRAPGSSPPEVCELWHEQDDEGKVLVNAILGFEIKHGRRLRPDDEAAPREKVLQIKTRAAPTG